MVEFYEPKDRDRYIWKFLICFKDDVATDIEIWFPGAFWVVKIPPDKYGVVRDVPKTYELIALFDTLDEAKAGAMMIL